MINQLSNPVSVMMSSYSVESEFSGVNSTFEGVSCAVTREVIRNPKMAMYVFIAFNKTQLINVQQAGMLPFNLVKSIVLCTNLLILFIRGFQIQNCLPIGPR